MKKSTSKTIAICIGSALLITSHPSLAYKKTPGAYHRSHDRLLNGIKAKAYVIFDETSQKVIAFRNKNLSLPIASLTKIMTAIVTLRNNENLNEKIRISRSDFDFVRHSRSHLSENTVITKRTALLLSLMASENRAAHALARTSSLGYRNFIQKMNQAAQELNLTHTHYVDPVGSETNNQSTAEELVRVIEEAERYPLIQKFSTQQQADIPTTGYKHHRFINTNRLVRGQAWQFLFSKTGFINESGRCLAFSSQVNNHRIITVILGSPSDYSRISDARRAHQWIMKSIKEFRTTTHADQTGTVYLSSTA